MLWMILGCGGSTELTITRVEVNPGVAIPLWADGETTVRNARQAPLPPGRDAWFFVHVDVPGGWSPQEVTATLLLETEDGERFTQEQTRLITTSTADWSEDDQGGLRYDLEVDDFEGFVFGVSGELIQPGVAWNVEIAGGMAAPEGVLMDLGVERAAPPLRLELVPIDLETPSCTASPDLSEEGLAPLIEHLRSMLPYGELILTEAEPLIWQQDTLSRSGILSMMAQDRGARGVGPETYSYGILDPCDTLEMMHPPGGAAALPLSTPDDSHAVEWFIAVLARNDYEIYGDADYEQYVFTHELSHLLGRPHIDCGNAAFPELAFPDPEGFIRDWGVDARTGRLFHPDLSHDIMAYCQNWWIAPYTWSRLWERLDALEEAASAARTEARPGRVLLGSIDTEAHWQVIDSPATRDRRGDAEIEILTTGGLLTLPAAVSFAPHDDALFVSATLPDGPLMPLSARLLVDDEVHPIPIEVLR